MKNINLFLILLCTTKCFSQWTTLNIPSAGRYDDIFFIDDSVGWAAGGFGNKIYKTTNGGSNWTVQYTSGKYLRSIVFATPTLGFCGSLDSSFFKTTDGGNTWTDIANTITPKPPGICGLSAPTSNIIYGCGIWSSPAYLIKSLDGGNSWTNIDLSALANAIVDVHFINADTGFVSGMANPVTEGGIILHTTDGGNTWVVKHKTMISEDYIWKLQTPDGLNYYGSVAALPVTGNVRVVKSNDSGSTWTTSIIRNTYSYIQTIGFLDSLQGWTGGNSTLFETIDGGLNWNSISVGAGYNRFFKTNDSTAFLSGARIYKYKVGNLSGIIDTQPFDEIHSLNISPNPASDLINIEMTIHNKTNCKLQLYSSDGKLIQSIYDGQIEKGTKQFSIQSEKISPQTVYLILKTNEGLVHRKIMKN
jgi:photosystem II stability/assembly factor-like uncharacterized protein